MCVHAHTLFIPIATLKKLIIIIIDTDVSFLIAFFPFVNSFVCLFVCLYFFWLRCNYVYVNVCISHCIRCYDNKYCLILSLRMHVVPPILHVAVQKSDLLADSYALNVTLLLLLFPHLR